jgi:hypothetical protein
VPSCRQIRIESRIPLRDCRSELTVEQPAIADAESLNGFQSVVQDEVAALHGDLSRITTYTVTPALSIVDVNGAAPRP